MKLHIVGTANRRISNIEPQPATSSVVSNVEGWFRSRSLFFKIDRIHSFDIQYSLFQRVVLEESWGLIPASAEDSKQHQKEVDKIEIQF